jgi:DNA repair protein RadC
VRSQPLGDTPLLNRPDLIREFLQPTAQGLAVEKFWVLSLNRKNRLIRCTEVSSGDVTPNF